MCAHLKIESISTFCLLHIVNKRVFTHSTQTEDISTHTFNVITRAIFILLTRSAHFIPAVCWTTNKIVTILLCVLVWLLLLYQFKFIFVNRKSINGFLYVFLFLKPMMKRGKTTVVTVFDSIFYSYSR